MTQKKCSECFDHEIGIYCDPAICPNLYTSETLELEEPNLWTCNEPAKFCPICSSQFLSFELEGAHHECSDFYEQK